MKTAILLIAHGSRRKSANDDLVRLAETVRKRNPDIVVEIAYLEIAEPTIPQGTVCCIEQGATDVLMLPYFLSAGEHALGDLERYRQQFTEEYTDVGFRLCPPLGLHPLIVDIVMARLEEGNTE